jgi:hypothetical protein
MPPPLHVEAANLQQLLARLAQLATTAVQHLFASHDDLAVLEQVYGPTVEPYIAGAANISAQWYHELDPAAAFAVEPAPLPPPEQFAVNVRWATATQDNLKTVGSSPSQIPGLGEILKGTTTRHVFNGSRDTIIWNADRENIRYARQASEDACAFCRMLALRSNMMLYKSEKSALTVVGRSGHARGTRKLGEKFHDDCSCGVVPIRHGRPYIPPDYVDGWKHEYKEAVAAEGNHSVKDIINHMRRTEYAETQTENVHA